MATLPDATQQPHDSASSLTVDMVIDWMLEQASYTGDLGYSSHFLKPDSLLKHAVVEPDRFSSTEPCVDRDFFGPDPVIKAMKRFSAEIEHLKARMNIMMSSQNRPVLIETEKEIHRRLLVAGKTDEDIKRCTLKKTPLRSKIVDWYILLNPINGREETVEVKIYLGERGRKKPVKINLPIHASMEKVYSLLSTHLTVELEALDPEGTKEIRHYDASKPWRYQLVTADQTTTVRKASIPLLSDADYRKMIYHITRRDIRPPTAHLSQEDPPRQSKTSPSTDSLPTHNQKDKGDLDEWKISGPDGRPLFEPVNWAMLAKKAEEGKGLEVSDEFLDEIVVKSWQEAIPENGE